MRYHDIIQLSGPLTARWIAKPRQINKIAFVLLALTCLLLIPFSTVQAQTGPKILIVTTDESKLSNNGQKNWGTTINDNAVKEFLSNAPANSTVVVDRTELGNGRPAPVAFFSDYDIVIVSAVFADIDSEDRTAISEAVLNKISNVFVFFVDSCGDCSSTNASWFLELIKNNATTFTPGQGAEVANYKTFPLNTVSPYAASFQSAPSIYGAYYKPYTDIPVDYILYKETDAPLTPPTGSANGLLIPLGEAKGSCTFATTDSSMFDSTAYSTNEKKIAPAFYAAAQGGSCFATVKQADLSVIMRGSVHSIKEKGEVTYTVTVHNAGPDEATNAQVKITLQPGLTFGSSSSCAEDPTGVLTCSLGDIAKDGNVQFTFTATASTGTTGRTLQATASVSSDTADPALGNNDGSDAAVATNVIGDVHIFTPDGLIYDFQSTGEFLAVQSSDSKVIVQARQENPANNPRVSVNTAAAFMVGDDKLEFYVKPAPSFQVNDVAINFPAELFTLDNGGGIDPIAVNEARREYIITWPDGSFKARLIMYSNSHIDYGIVALGGSQTYEGLLGNLDGNAQNDLQIRGGGQIKPPPSTDDLNRFGDSWRVSAEASLFDISEDTTNQANTAEQPLTMQDIDSVDREAAQETCQEAGISDQIALRNCTYDVAVTGDEIFVESAKVFEESIENLPPSAIVPATVGETLGGAIFDANLANEAGITIMDGDDLVITTGKSADGAGYLRFNIYRNGDYVVSYSVGTDTEVADALAGAMVVDAGAPIIVEPIIDVVAPDAGRCREGLAILQGELFLAEEPAEWLAFYAEIEQEFLVGCVGLDGAFAAAAAELEVAELVAALGIEEGDLELLEIFSDGPADSLTGAFTYVNGLVRAHCPASDEGVECSDILAGYNLYLQLAGAVLERLN